MHYHMIWTTYGTWLPGDERGWMRKNDPAVQPPNPELQQACRNGMSEDAVLLDEEQQKIVAATITATANIASRKLLNPASKTNHVIVVCRSGSRIMPEPCW